MRRIGLSAFCLLLGIVWHTVAVDRLALPGALRAAELNTPRSAADLVQAALATELNGPSDARRSLLEQAIKLDPNYAPARWHAGYIRHDERWLTPEEVANTFKSNENVAAYRARREAMIDTADEHRELAIWCQRKGLTAESRVHWAKVLEFLPQDEKSQTALGLQWFAGRLMTREQIDQAKKEAGQQQRANQEWRPKATKWRDAIDRGTAKQREAALADLKAIDDPLAIPALEAAFATNSAIARNVTLYKTLIDTVGSIADPAATAVLLRAAILPDADEVRAYAAAELKKRPMHTYVPTLIGALPGQLKTRFHVYILPNGMVTHEHEVQFEGRGAVATHTYRSIDNPARLIASMFFTPRAFRQQAQLAANIETQAAATQSQLDWLRQRVQAALQATTGFSDSANPDLWERQYAEYQGWTAAEPAKRRYYQNDYDTRGYVFLPVETTLTREERRTPTVQVSPTGEIVVLGTSSCFPAGTTVTTADGAVAIEKVRVGDRVLAQDVKTGEISFKPVQATTLRRPTPLMRVTCGPHSIVATIGHPFWIVGDGWRTTRHLKVGDTIHGLEGASTVDQIEEMPPSEAYNLVVSENHNYFVGKAQLLVHDNSPILESSGPVPGLAAKQQ